VGSIDHRRSGSIPNFFPALQQKPNRHPVDALFNSKTDAARFITNLNEMIRGFVAGNLIVGSMQGAIPLGIASGLLKSASVPRTDLFTCAFSCGGHPAVQHTGTVYGHHANNSPAACRVCEPSYSQIYCHSRKYRAGGGDGWDSLLGLVVGCDGLAAGCAAHGIRQAYRGFASILMSLLRHAVTRASSDSTLGAIRRNGFGTGNSLLAQGTWPPRVPSNPSTIMTILRTGVCPVMESYKLWRAAIRTGFCPIHRGPSLMDWTKLQLTDAPMRTL